MKLLKLIVKLFRKKTNKNDHLHEPGSGKCGSCRSWNSDERICTVIFIGPKPNSTYYDHYFIKTDADDSCLYEGIEIASIVPDDEKLREEPDQL